jgi:hypothetical protein
VRLPGPADSALAVSGRTLLDLAREDFSDPRSLAEAKQLMRTLIGHYTGGKAPGQPQDFQGATGTMIELGVNIDHVATIRQARCTYEPDPVWAAVEAHLGGADGITIHLREDRRHIQDADVEKLRELAQIKLNLEMAATDEMIAIACRDQAADGDAGARRPPRSDDRRRARHLARKSALRQSVAASPTPASSAASSSTPTRRRWKRPRASARVSARSTPAPTRMLLHPGTGCRKPGGARRTRQDPRRRQAWCANSACASTPGTRSTTSTSSRSRNCLASASCTSGTRSSAGRFSSALREAVREMKRLLREAQALPPATPT